MALEVSIRDSRAGDHRKGLGRRIMYGPEKPQKCWRFVLSRIIIFKFQVLSRAGPSRGEFAGRRAYAAQTVLELAAIAGRGRMPTAASIPGQGGLLAHRESSSALLALARTTDVGHPLPRRSPHKPRATSTLAISSVLLR